MFFPHCVPVPVSSSSHQTPISSCSNKVKLTLLRHCNSPSHCAIRHQCSLALLPLHALLCCPSREYSRCTFCFTFLPVMHTTSSAPSPIFHNTSSASSFSLIFPQPVQLSFCSPSSIHLTSATTLPPRPFAPLCHFLLFTKPRATMQLRAHAPHSSSHFHRETYPGQGPSSIAFCKAIRSTYVSIKKRISSRPVINCNYFKQTFHLHFGRQTCPLLANLYLNLRPITPTFTLPKCFS